MDLHLEEQTAAVESDKGCSDIHIYHYQQNSEQVKYASELYERIRRECKCVPRHHQQARADSPEVPELRIYKFWDRPIGPHPVAMFEVNVFTPAQFGAFIPWLAIWRGPLSVLVHPNTRTPDGVEEWAEELRNHTQRAIWMGERMPLDTSLFYRMGGH